MNTHQQTAILIGRNLRDLRTAKNKTGTQIARKIGASHSQYYGWENGRALIRLDRLIAIAQYLDVNVCHFFEE